MEVVSSENDQYLHSDSSQRPPSPDLFSSEDEDGSRTDVFPGPLASSSSPKIGPSDTKNKLILELESARLQRLLTQLQGVPPPPSVTIPQITLNEVLVKLKQNAHMFVIPAKSEESVNSLWIPTASLEKVLKTDWPEIKDIVYHDMHFNLCTASEDVEHVSMKLHERFIGAETSSWCNAVTSLPNSAKKRQRRSLGNASPGCRLSHLARRRQTFSSANIAQLSSVAGSGTAGGAPVPGSSLSVSRRRLTNGGTAGQRCIMVEIKKTDKNKRIKTNSKEVTNKLPPSANAPKNVTAVPATVHPTKRALFQSPEEQKRSRSQQGVSEVHSVQRSKRALWPSDGESIVNDNGKRTLDNSDSSSCQRSKVHCSEDRVPYSRATRSLPFPLNHNSGSSNANASNSSWNGNNANENGSGNKHLRRASDQGPSQEINLKVELSELHKRKLFWAITSALRVHNINRNHPDFTRLSSILVYHYIEVRSNIIGPPPASTSEHMLNVVSAKAAEVIQGEKAAKSGQEENLGGSKIPKKEERSNKELFRDATASLNVRRSLCVSLSSSNNQLSEDKPKPTKRVPSARKSLSFDTIDPKTASGTVHDDLVEKTENKFQIEGKGNESKWKGNGENVPLTSAKRVSRSLFLSPKDEVKVTKKDACELTLAPENQPTCTKSNDGALDILDDKKSLEVSDVDERLQQPSSEVSSIPSISAASSTLEADNEASRTSEATSELNSVDASINLGTASSDIISKGSGVQNPLGILEIVKADSGSSESSDFMPTRVLRETRERILRVVTVQPVRRSVRKSLSLSKREVRSSSSDSTEQERASSAIFQDKPNLPNKVDENSRLSNAVDVSEKFQPMVVLSPLKIPSPSVSAESNTKSTFGSPPFIVDNTLTPAHSPFLGFPSKEDLNSSGGVADESNSTAKVPDGSSEEGNLSDVEHLKKDMEQKVITPLIEAAALESSVCVGSGSSRSTDTDLTFRGRIEGLKSSGLNETAINLDFGMNLNVSSNLLSMEENKEKSPVLEKWAERASRSAQKTSLPVEETSDAGTYDGSVVSGKSRENIPEESMVPWDESQLDGVSQCSSNVYEKFCSIFGSSSQQENS